MKMIEIFLVLVLVSVVSFSAYEIYALSNAQPGDTISEVFWQVSGSYPILPFMLGLLIGVLAGHFFWQRPS